MLKFKDYIAPNIGLFFRHKSTVDVFIEDNNDDEFYLALVNRVFEKSGHKINKLLALGSKENVINACKEDQGKRNENRIYIVDGDLDLILNRNPSGMRHLFVLKRYCIENYLLDADAIIEIIHDHLVIDKNKIRNQLSFNNWLDQISQSLVDLFLHYAICREVIPTEPTVSLKVGNLCAEIKKTTVLQETKCQIRIQDLQNKILEEISEEDYDYRISSLRKEWPPTIQSLMTIVSGKDYLGL